MKPFMRIGSAFLFVVQLSSSGWAQFGIISTYAGPQLPLNGSSAISQAIDGPISVVSDGAGGFYVGSRYLPEVYRVTVDGKLNLVAGNGTCGFSGDGGPAILAQLTNPLSLTADSTGNLFIADFANSRIRKVTPGGIISTVAGNGTPGYSGDGGQATLAQLQLNYPSSLAIDTAGNLFIAETYNHRIRMVSPGGIISTVAGNGTTGFSGDGGPAASAQLNYPSGLAVDTAGNLFIADTINHRVRRVSPDGIINTIAGSGDKGMGGDGGPATSAMLNEPSGLAIDAVGNLLIADHFNMRIRMVTPGGIISTVAGNGSFGFSGDGGLATAAQLWSPDGLAVDTMGNLLIADQQNNRVRRVTPDGIISTAAGNGTAGYSGDGGISSFAQFNNPCSAAVDMAGNLFIFDAENNRIRKITPAGIVSTIAGDGIRGFGGDDGPATSARLANQGGIAVDAAGNLFIADAVNSRIRKVTPGGIISTVAGNGTAGYSGDGSLATSARLNFPRHISVDMTGNLFIADSANHRVRKVTPNGIISTVAGNGTAGYSGDGGPATSAQLDYPRGLAIDTAGNLFIAEDDNRVRKVTPDGIISTVAGNGSWGYSGDGGLATAAQLWSPNGLAVDTAGNLLIADRGNNRVRRVAPDGIISTVAGNAISGFSGDGGPATSAQLDYPSGLAVDSAGNIFIVDEWSQRIRKITAKVSTPRFSPHPITDFNSDGKADIFWRNQTAGNLYIWQMNGAAIGAHGSPGSVADLNWKIYDFADFDGDGVSDVLWRYATTGESYIWLMNGPNPRSIGSPGAVTDLLWQIQGLVDFNGDGKADILWQHVVTGQLYIWLMDGLNPRVMGSPGTVADLKWRIQGLADFDGDSKTDILWRHAVTGQVYLWLMDGLDPRIMGCPGTVADLAWQIQCIGDFNSDGKADLLWRHATTGEVYVWLLKGKDVLANGSLGKVSDPDWQIQSQADFDGDGRSDILWRHNMAGQLYIWLINGTSVAVSGCPGTVSDLRWQIESVADFNGDDKADLLWRHRATGQLYIWLMNGINPSSLNSPYTVSDLAWMIEK